MSGLLRNSEIDRRACELGARLRAVEQTCVDPTVTVRRLRLTKPAPVLQCVRCGRKIPGKCVTLPSGSYHARCAPTPAPTPPPTLTVVADEPVVRDTRPQHGIRRTHLPASDRARVLAWLGENGPATARMVAWALDVNHREVALLLRSLEGRQVEPTGVLDTDRRGHPPTVWQIRTKVAA